jgi:hypothetical protein
MTVELRRTSIEALRGFRPFGMTFSGRGDGYAVFARCDAAVDLPCEGRLFATEDNGKTWVQRTLPVTRARSWGVGIAKVWGSRDPTINVVAWKTFVVVRADPVGWLVSADGRAFTLRPMTPKPYEVSLLSGEFHARCPDGGYDLEHCTPEVVRVTSHGTSALAVQPPIPGYVSSVKASDDGSVWAASFHQGRAFTAVSRDEGATWERHDVPAPPDGSEVPWVDVFPAWDGTVWLSGTHPDAITKPRLWYFDRTSDGWVAAVVDLPPPYRPFFCQFRRQPPGHQRLPRADQLLCLAARCASRQWDGAGPRRPAWPTRRSQAQRIPYRRTRHRHRRTVGPVAQRRLAWLRALRRAPLAAHRHRGASVTHLAEWIVSNGQTVS